MKKTAIKKSKNSKKPKVKLNLKRRDFLSAAGLAGAASLAGPLLSGVRQVLAKQENISSSASNGKRYNILFILTDQERLLDYTNLPPGYMLPGHNRLLKNGTLFTNHQVASMVCSSSRAVIYTGQHIQHNGMFDNTNFPWVKDLSRDIPTIGHMLRQAGYHTGYKGKWHLTKAFEEAKDFSNLEIFTSEMEEYGFSDYYGVGDIIGRTLGGYHHDGIIAAMANHFFKVRGQPLNSEGKPWFLAVNFVNPHDVMYYDTDGPGEMAQKKNKLMAIAKEPADPLYSQQWNFELPESRHQALDAPGRPAAHLNYDLSKGALTGRIPDDDARWRRLNNYYLNCILDVDRNMVRVFDTLDALGMADNTIIVMTADHGELGGGHGLHGKGATAYREQNNVPLIISHPDYPGGRTSRAVTSHLDLAPSFLAMAGGSASHLKGRDISSLLAASEEAGFEEVRPGALYNFNMLLTVDGDWVQKAAHFILAGGNPKDLKAAGIQWDLMKRGAIRSIFDGRYKFNRYFSPKQHNRPTTMEQLFMVNDIELFDNEKDPLELNNLAMDRTANGELLMHMNKKLNTLIDNEVGEDKGQMLPGGMDAGWAISRDGLDA